MIYHDFQGLQLSALGFGAMRLPLMEDGTTVNAAAAEEMIDYALSAGANYFDTAYPYHSGQSERVVGKILSKYPRDSFYLATKYPGHQIVEKYDPAAIFEEQLEKCGVDYFDFYLLHNVNENSARTYMDPKWGILDYFKEQKRLGRIRHLGFSCHCSVELLREFLDFCGDAVEFCQIQLNYLDWTLQDAKSKYELLTERGIPVWVMEPVRGGKLAKLGDSMETQLKALRPEESIPAWGFRFLQELPNVTMVLSGMSNMEQMKDNIGTFSALKPLSAAEQEKLQEIAEGLKKSVPCTACRYCCDGCPQGLDIPNLLSLLNEARFSSTMIIRMRLEALPADKLPSACIGCGQCVSACPQKIDIPAALAELNEKMEALPTWAETSRKRAEAQR